MSVLLRLAAIIALALIAIAPASAAEKRFLLATTTSTENSGLLDAIIPQFTAATGISLDVVAVGTGQALEMGRRGDAAAILVHDRVGEDKFVAEGHGTDRRDVMYNDFVIIGPEDDPANLARAEDTRQAMTKIADGQVVFVSRGDDSGTHRKELRLWAEAGLDPATFGGWYREAGAGMGQTILTTTQMSGYTMTDRATWVKFGRKDGHAIAFEEDPPLFNPYASIVVTNAAVPAEETGWATAWHQWLTSETGRNAIRAYRVDGQQLFFIAGDEEAG
ncbi:MAG: substrate-binding domain-containing protein [Roseitalea sp.]|jgi:tungstate transport system substrate-binding protein|nr:substrate-binding domain-containing protein [Roseitalea sp.]MBO6721271.1 substrate-binding domain-containing protein [Roseitalea sp.]MBO6742245.1 substrate-binding domain-containing protein [Roseitalea sp.]